MKRTMLTVTVLTGTGGSGAFSPTALTGKPQFIKADTSAEAATDMCHVLSIISHSIVPAHS